MGRYEVLITEAANGGGDAPVRQVRWIGEAASGERAVEVASREWRNSFKEEPPPTAVITCEAQDIEPCSVCGGQGRVSHAIHAEFVGVTTPKQPDESDRTCPRCRGTLAQVTEPRPDGGASVYTSTGAQIFPGEPGYVPPPGPPD